MGNKGTNDKEKEQKHAPGDQPPALPATMTTEEKERRRQERLSRSLNIGQTIQAENERVREILFLKRRLEEEANKVEEILFLKRQIEAKKDEEILFIKRQVEAKKDEEILFIKRQIEAKIEEEKAKKDEEILFLKRQIEEEKAKKVEEEQTSRETMRAMRLKKDEEEREERMIIKREGTQITKALKQATEEKNPSPQFTVYMPIPVGIPDFYHLVITNTLNHWFDSFYSGKISKSQSRKLLFAVYAKLENLHSIYPSKELEMYINRFKLLMRLVEHHPHILLQAVKAPSVLILKSIVQGNVMVTDILLRSDK